MKKDITELYSFIDDFCKTYEKHEKQRLLPAQKQRNRDCKISLAEQMTIMGRTAKADEKRPSINFY